MIKKIIAYQKLISSVQSVSRGRGIKMFVFILLFIILSVYSGFVTAHIVKNEGTRGFVQSFKAMWWQQKFHQMWCGKALLYRWWHRWWQQWLQQWWQQQSFANNSAYKIIFLLFFLPNLKLNGWFTNSTIKIVGCDTVLC